MSLQTTPSLTHLKQLSLEELKVLSDEIRKKILKVLSKNGGHLSSNLGVVELTLALHRVFHSPVDKFIFDTSHQIYTHKILTERKKPFETLRMHDGLSGFANPAESEHDTFYSGHAGICLSSSLGLALGRKEDSQGHIISILGDGSFTCGLTFEALNNIPANLKNFIVVLNDNKMAISENVGNISSLLSRWINHPKANNVYGDIETFFRKIPVCQKVLEKLKGSIKNLVSPAQFFEHFGLKYVGPIDGHDLSQLISTLEGVKNSRFPILVHVLTQKGKGLTAALKNPTCYHGVKSFDLQTGSFLEKITKKSFSHIFGKALLSLAEKTPFTVLTPAMISGSGLTEFAKLYPARCIDVGIAEGHCIAFGGALAKHPHQKVIVSIYSSFLQRGFDNIFHDVCLQRSPVLFAIDRAGLSSHDGPSHHGIYDIGFLHAMPGMVICQPRNGTILRSLLNLGMKAETPFAIRYPNLFTEESEGVIPVLEIGKGETLKSGKDLLIIALGHMTDTALKASEILQEKGIYATVVDPIFLKPLDRELLIKLLSNHKYVVTLEEHSVHFGLGTIINSFIIQNNCKNLEGLNLGIPDRFVEHGDYASLMKELQLDAESVASQIENRFYTKANAEKL